MSKLTIILASVAAIGICYIWYAQGKIRSLENDVTTYQEVIQMRDSVISIYKTNNEALQTIAKQREAFEASLSTFMARTNTQLKKVLQNDQKAKEWGDTAIPDSLLQLRKDNYSSFRGKTDTTGR